MTRPLRTGVFTFLVALAIQARLIRSGDLTPTWPAVIGVIAGLAMFAFVRLRSRHSARET